MKYTVQFMTEPSNKNTVAISDWKERFSVINIDNNRIDISSAIIEKLSKNAPCPFVLLDYWKTE